MVNEVSFPKLGLEFTLNPVAIQIGDFSIYWYGVIIATGFLLAVLYCVKSAKSFNVNSDGFFDCAVIGLIAGVIGARLYYVVFYPGDKYWVNPLEILNIKDGGLGIYGGIIFGLIAGVIVAKKKKLSLGSVLDLGCLGFLIGQGIGRWGNFVNQEAFGDATDLPWGMRSASTELIVPDANVHPCFLYESILCFVGFLILHYFSRKFRRYDGQVALLYAIWYGISRYCIEAMRTDSLMIPVINIKVSQAVALGSILLAVAVLVFFRKRTSLTGCGCQKIIELNSIVIGEIKENKNIEPQTSTVFGGEEYVKSVGDLEDMNEEAESDDSKIN